MKKRILFFLSSSVVGLILFFWIIDFVGWEEVKKALLVFTGWQGMVILFLTFLILLIGNWRWKEILKGQGIEIPFWKIFDQYLAGFSLTFLAPALLWAGEIFRAYSLKEKEKISWSKSLSSVIIDIMMERTMNLIVIIFGSFIFLTTIGFPSNNLLIIFGGAFIILLILVIIFYLKVIKKESIIKDFARVFKETVDDEPFDAEKEIFKFFKKENRYLVRSFLISFLRALIMYFRALFLISFLGEHIAGFLTLSILGFTYLASIVPIPAALGSHEAIQIFAFNSLNLGASAATAFTVIIRASELVFVLMGSIIFIRLGFLFLKRFLFKNTGK